MWTHDDTVTIAATPRTIWAVFVDTGRRNTWNAGVADITLHGPFATGTTFTMRMPDDTRIDSVLVAVEPERGFTDETRLGATRVVVHHRIDAVDAGRTRVTFATEVHGPDAPAVGPMISGDFPQVLRSLKALLEG